MVRSNFIVKKLDLTRHYLTKLNITLTFNFNGIYLVTILCEFGNAT